MLLRTLRTSALYACADLAGKLCTLATLAFAARILSGDQYGQLIGTLAAAWLWSLVFDFGFAPRLTNLTLSGTRAAGHVWFIRWLCLPIALGLGGVMLLCGLPLIVVASLILGQTITLIAAPALIALQRPVLAVGGLVGSQALWLALCLLTRPEGALGWIGLMALSNVVSAGLGCVSVAQLRPRFDSATGLVVLARESVSTAVFGVASNAYGRADTVLLAILLKPEVAGGYGTAYRFVTTTVGLTTFVSAVAARRLRSDRRLQRGLERAFVGMAGTAVVVLAVALGPLTSLVSGHPLDVVTVLLLSLVAAPAVMTVYYTQTALLYGARTGLMRASVFTALAASIAYPIAIVSWGPRGAAAVSVMIELVAAIMFRRVLTLLPIGPGLQGNAMPSLLK